MPGRSRQELGGSMQDSPSPNGANRAGIEKPVAPAGKPRAKSRPAENRDAAKKPTRGDVSSRTAGGRFAPGNAGGPGNPYARAIGQLRSALLAAVTPDDIQAIIAGLVEEARAGNVAAAREVLDRCLGRPVEADLLIRLEALEEAAARSVEHSRGSA